MCKPWHVGQCARNGLQAARLAEAGLTANLAALDHHQGVVEVYNGTGNYTSDKLLEAWAQPLDIIEPGVAFKRHPCCASTHPAIDALLQLMTAHDLDAGNVRTIHSRTHPRRFKHTNRPDPVDGLDGKFSIQYVLALALSKGHVSVQDFTDEKVRCPDIRHIMARIRCEADPDASMRTSEHFYADVEITDTDGRVYSQHVDRPLGRDRQHPLPPGTLETKFVDCSNQILKPEHTEALMTRLAGLETETSIRELSSIMESGLRTSDRTLINE